MLILKYSHNTLTDMNRIFQVMMLSGVMAVGFSLSANAVVGPPHSVEAKANYSDVNLTWKAPEAAKTLQWHNDYDYDGDAGRTGSQQQPCAIWIASEWSPEDLSSWVGEKITALNYFEYRAVYRVTAYIWEDGKVVREQVADLSNYKKNSYRTITFSEPYEIQSGKKVRFGFKIEHGPNMDFVAIMNNSCDSRGDLYSYDGAKWFHNGRGTYLITALLENKTDESPTGYNVLVNGTKVNTEPVAGTAYALAAQPDGTYTYTIEAIYGTGNQTSKPVTVQVKSADSYFASVAYASIATSGVDGVLTWNKPLIRDNSNLLTWTTSVKANNIGGTSTTAPKVWIKNEFSAEDLLSFKGATIKGVRAQFAEKEVNELVIFVMKDNVIVQFDTVAPAVIEGIQPDAWVSMPFSQGVTITPGHSYAYGYYMTHTKSKHPVSVDNGVAVGAKGNSFSISSPSKAFESSKPSWKTLASGNITGNWILAAEVEGGTVPTSKVASYNVYCNGNLIKSGLTETTLDVVAEAPGSYTYGVEVVGTDGNTSNKYNVKGTFKLPDDYRAPLLEAGYNRKDNKVDLTWSMDTEIKHYGAPTFVAGFAEEMALEYGARFTAAELAEYKNYKINKLTFIIGKDIPGGFSLQVHKGDGTKVMSYKINQGEVTAQAMYTLTLDEPIVITGTDDLILSYAATLPANLSAIVFDGGPAVAGGAVVRIGGAGSWMNMGTINSDVKNYNIVIGATAQEADATASAPTVELGATASQYADLPHITLSAADLRDGFGVDATQQSLDMNRVRTATKPASFNVYRNGELIANVADKKFTDEITVPDTYEYTVSAVYPNGWESAESEGVVINAGVDNTSPAPYNLRHDDNGLLLWESPESAPILSHCTSGDASYGVGMTGSGTRESYIVQLFEPEHLAAFDGKQLTHIKFGLYTTEVYTASVIIFDGFNIIYEQPVPVDSLKAIATDGYNVIRLNVPYTVDATRQLRVGYHITYANGIKPMLFDAGPALDNYGNLLSASASDTSWKSLLSMNKSLDGNWRIYAIFNEKNVSVERKAIRAEESPITYNLYCDGQAVATGLTENRYKFESYDAIPAGSYTVTAVRDGRETAPSNSWSIGDGVGTVANDIMGYYDRAANMLVVSGEAIVYNAAGQKVMNISSSANVNHLPAGVYIVVLKGGKTFKFNR